MNGLLEDEFEWIENDTFYYNQNPKNEEFCSLILYEERTYDVSMDNHSPPSLISLEEETDLFNDSLEESFSSNAYQLLTASEEFQSQQQIEAEVQRTLVHCVYLFSVSGRFDQTEDLRNFSVAPIRFLYSKIGYFSTVSKSMMQEFIDMFKTLKMIVLKVEEAKLDGRWSLFWNYTKWSQDIYSISKEIRSFIQYLEDLPKNSVAEDHTLLHYSPNIRVKPIGVRLRPSSREKTREALWKRYHRPISFQTIQIQWFLDLFYLFDKYLEWTGRIDPRTLLEGTRLLFGELTCSDQQNLITICEDTLGGLSLDHISTNLVHWIQLNKDIIPSSILRLVEINT